MNTSLTTIEMIHDITCSWCPIGYRNIQSALDQMSDARDVHFSFLPYQLNPHMSSEGETVESYLRRRRNWTSGQFEKYRKDLVATAGRGGLNYDFSRRTHYWNTAKAHVLMHISERYNKQKLVNERLIDLYFKQGLKIDEDSILLSIGRSVGIDDTELSKAFTSEEVAAEMQRKYAHVQSLGVSSIPTFIVNGTDVITGSNSVAFFVDYFQGLEDRSLGLGEVANAK